jgi:AcrR family transcriptional regulator
MHAMPGLREHKRRATRERLEEAALTLFERKGYDATRVEEIAATAGVSTRTAFRYFPTKADLVFADSEIDRERMLEAVRAVAAHSPDSFAAMRAGLDEFARGLAAPRTVWRARVVAANAVLGQRALAVRADWTAALAAQVAALEGLDAPDSRCTMMAEAGMAALTVGMMGWARAGGSGDLGAAVSAALDDVVQLGR